MTSVLYTVDTELSLMMQLKGFSGRENFDSAIAGKVEDGHFGIPYQLEILDRHGLKFWIVTA